MKRTVEKYNIHIKDEFNYVIRQIHLFRIFAQNTILYPPFPPSVGNPMSLQQLSRLALRTELGTRALKVIGQLNIPKLIINYLCY